LNTSFRAYRSMGHPLWLGALVLLVVNDHFLKGAGVLPGWVTGKLSDLAGMLVAPVVLASLLAVRTRRGFLLAHVAVGAVFGAIKLSPEAARGLEALTALGPFPWTVAVDPTDLIALPLLPLAYVVLFPSGNDAPQGAAGGALGSRPPLAYKAALAASALACVASSEPGRLPSTGRSGPQSGALLITNDSGSAQVLRVRELKESVAIDCSAVSQGPSATLSRDAFAPASLWLIDAGLSLPLQRQGTRECSAYLIDGDELRPRLVFFRSSEFPTTRLTPPTTVRSDGPNISLGSEGPRLSLGDHPAVFAAPNEAGEPPAEACRLPEAGASLDWSTPVPSGKGTLHAVTASPDGCFALDLTKSRFYLCAPLQALPCQPGDSVELSSLAVGQSGGAIDGVELRCGDTTLRLARGGDLAPWSATHQAASFTTRRAPGCQGQAVECGSVALPLEVSLSLPEGASSVAPAGEPTTLPAGNGSLVLVRAQSMPVVDTDCFPSVMGAGGRLLESMVYFSAQPL
jgi:hypothetical protein